ncbi:MAG: hypothetical protein IPJ13_26330 [Saprospiraceae bacterium]|nr:hypothetical protein [Saprospiraceae bacterium]
MKTYKLDSLIKTMLNKKNEERPNISKVFEILRSPDILTEEIISTDGDFSKEIPK